MEISWMLSSFMVYLACHSQLDWESSNVAMFWIPAFAGMTLGVAVRSRGDLTYGISILPLFVFRWMTVFLPKDPFRLS